MTPFSPQPLSESPVPENVDTQPASDEAVEGDASEGSAPAGGSVYSYSASISARGGWDNLYNLLGILADTSGVELTQYSYSEGGGEDADKGSFSMTMKFYVFIEEETAWVDETLFDGEPSAETGETPAEAVEAPVE
jgi:hypothetical protein